MGGIGWRSVISSACPELVLSQVEGRSRGKRSESRDVISSEQSESRNLIPNRRKRFLDSTPLPFDCAQDRQLRFARNDG